MGKGLVSGDIIDIKNYDTGQFSTNFGLGVAIFLNKSIFIYFDYKTTMFT